MRSGKNRLNLILSISYLLVEKGIGMEWDMHKLDGRINYVQNVSPDVNAIQIGLSCLLLFIGDIC